MEETEKKDESEENDKKKPQLPFSKKQKRPKSYLKAQDLIILLPGSLM